MSYQTAKAVTLVSALSNGALALLKMLAGFVTSSHGLLADGIHSLSDLLTDFLVIVAAKYGSVAADDDHPYGHQRIETAATFFLSLLLVITGVAIAIDGYHHLYQHHAIHHSNWALLVIFMSLVVNEGLFHFTMHFGKKINSKLLIANAWHHRSDSLSSLVVCIGLIGSAIGYGACDAIAAMVVGLFIIKMGWSIGWNSLQELIDRAIEPTLIDEMKQAIVNTDGVVAVHQLRTRSMAGDIFVDVHVLVNEKITVSEGHFIGQNVAANIRQAVKAVADVTVHIDPEDDETGCPSINLPTRTDCLADIRQRLAAVLTEADIFRVNLHYLNGAIAVELFLVAGAKVDSALCQKVILAIPLVIDVQIFQLLEVG